MSKKTKAIFGKSPRAKSTYVVILYSLEKLKEKINERNM